MDFDDLFAGMSREDVLLGAWFVLLLLCVVAGAVVLRYGRGRRQNLCCSFFSSPLLEVRRWPRAVLRRRDLPL
jgi:hypothetical protein